MTIFAWRSRTARSMKAFLMLTTALVLAASFQPAAASAAGFSVTLVQGGFTKPVYVTNAGDLRLFVVEQTGKIKIIGGGTFLDLTAKIRVGEEQGLLGLAFHPDYATNGLFYVKYNRNSDGKNVIAEYKVSDGDPNVAAPNSARIVMTYEQPTVGHNGGWLGFSGQYLYISQGDAALAKSPAQNRKRLLGKILRIDPLDPDGNGPLKYSIPADNPFVSTAFRPEIWAYGLRNPWRCSFDNATGNLWCGDAGQSKHEEVDRSDAAGNNYGWPLLEGFHYYKYPNKPVDGLCTGDCKVLPIAEYGHGRRCVIIGGYVSRRPGADLEGNYVFGDYCTSQVWVIPADYVAGTKLPPPVADLTGKISSFGEGADGKLYIVDIAHGRVSVINNS